MASAVTEKTATAPVEETKGHKETSKTGIDDDEADEKSPAALEDEDCKDDDVLSSTLRSCANDPDFAVICAFLQKFAHDLDLNVPNFKQMQEWLTNTDEGTYISGCIFCCG